MREGGEDDSISGKNEDPKEEGQVSSRNGRLDVGWTRKGAQAQVTKCSRWRLLVMCIWYVFHLPHFRHYKKTSHI